jgi:DNA polymerase III sliding clamp (beta) subunit (PCNA family)
MDRKELSQALKLTKSALGTNSAIPGLDCFYFDKNTVTTYNTHLGIIGHLTSEFPYRGYIPGTTFVKLVNEMGDELQVTVTDDHTLLLKSGSSKVKLKALSNTEPIFVKPDTDNMQLLPASSQFINGLKRCMLSLPSGKSISPDEAGVYISAKDGMCSLYSTNGATISAYTYSLAQAGEAENVSSLNMMMPAAMCEQLGFLMDELMSCPTRVGLVENEYIVAIYPKLELYCSFYAAPPKRGLESRVQGYLEDLEFHTLPKNIDDCLKRCEIVAGEDSVVKLAYEPEKLIVSSSSKGLGEVVDEFPFTTTTSGSITIDIKLLKRVLDDAAKISFNADYICLEGKDNNFKHIIAKKEVM